VINMRKNKLYSIFLFLALSISAQAQMFEISPRDAAKLPNRKLVVVLQEEEPEMLNRIKKDPEKIQRYKALIAYTNNLLKKTVASFWTNGQTIEYKTLKECMAIADSSEAYVTLEFASLRQNENTQLYFLKPDTSNLFPLRRTLMQRKEYGFFDLKLIEKFRGTPLYSFVTPSSVPNEYDFITAIQFMSSLVKEKIADPKFSTRDYELKIQQANDKLFHRILIVDSNIVNKQSKSYNYIRNEYDSTSLYELTDPKGIVERVNKDKDTKDTMYAYLNIIPYIDPLARGQSFLGTSGGNINDYEKTIYYMQIVIDASSGEVLYYDKAEESVVIVRDWRRFLRFSREKVPFFPPIQKSTDPNAPPPVQKQYQNQYQQNNQY
jgi:hypothetical protein